MCEYKVYVYDFITGDKDFLQTFDNFVDADVFAYEKAKMYMINGKPFRTSVKRNLFQIITDTDFSILIHRVKG